MTSTWSLVLNVVLLASVVFILVRSIRGKKDTILPMDPKKPIINLGESKLDDIITIRKVELAPHSTAASPQTPEDESSESLTLSATLEEEDTRHQDVFDLSHRGKTMMLFLLAKSQRQLAGYEMLQSILAADLRFGEGQLFHKHQFEHAQGPVIFSLAAATLDGVFDLQNIGAFQAKGLCLFMHLSGNTAVDEERFNMMLATAQQLSENLDTILLDEKRQPINNQSAQYYQEMIQRYSLECA